MILDDRAPHPFLGAGYPRAFGILRLLAELAHEATFIPCVFGEPPHSAARAIPGRFTYQAMGNTTDIANYVADHAQDYDLLWVSRPHNMAMLQRFLPKSHPVWNTFPLVIYDAEAIFALRTELMRGYYPDESPGMSLEEELDLAEVADAVAVVNDREGRFFQQRKKKTVVLATYYELAPNPPCFDQTSGFLLVGSLRGNRSPNVDALRWFCQYVVPILRSELGAEFHLNIVGITEGVDQSKLGDTDIRFLGMIPDLKQIYSQHRIFIAPHRFAAGIAAKILEASEHGIPVVATNLLAEQLNWSHDREIFVAETNNAEAFAAACLVGYRKAEAWQQVQAGARKSVARDYSRGTFQAALETLLMTTRN